jgi:hypothetical protein
LPTFAACVIVLTKIEAPAKQLIEENTSWAMRDGEYGAQAPENNTPYGSVAKNGGGAVASMGGPGRY